MYTDEDTLREFGRLTRIYAALAANYTRAAVRQNAAQHTPVMRPLFLMFEDDPQSFLQASLNKKCWLFVKNLSILTVFLSFSSVSLPFSFPFPVNI